MAQPDVILVNGCSSAGKSSICRALQQALAAPHVLSGLDDFVFRLLPPQLHGTAAGVYFETLEDGSVPVRFGPAGQAMQRAFHRSVAEVARAGLPVIVDEVILGPELLEDWLVALNGLQVLFVGVRCDLEELKRRELARGDRQPGQVQSHFQLVHAHGDYDVEVDTTRATTADCVEQIRSVTATGAGASNAFDRLRTQAALSPRRQTVR